jgi:hypothetical protein
MQLFHELENLQKNSILPCTFQPGEGELLSSWLVRLAHAHQIKIHSFCQYLWPDVAIWNRDVDKLAPVVVLNTLAAQTFTSAHRIKQMTLAPVIERLTGAALMSRQAQASWLMPLGIYHRTHRSQGLVYCPHCLQRDGAAPYYRTSWRLAFHVVCPTCGIYLHEGCPACGKPVNFFRIELGRKSSIADRPISTCYNCAFDLSQSSARVASPKTLRRYRSLYRISREGWNRSIPYPHQYFRVLRQIIGLLTSRSERVVTLQVDMRLRLAQPVEWPTSWISFEQIPITGRIYLLDQAMWLLTDWPDRFIAVMRYHRINSTSLLRDMSGEVPFWFSTIVSEQFYITNINRRFIPPAPERLEKGRNQFIAPIKGLAGSPRKQDSKLTCPQCHSHWINRNGLREGKQRYECQQCRRHFTDADALP